MIHVGYKGSEIAEKILFTKPALAITKKAFRYSYLEFLFFRNYELVEKDLVKVTYC